jgi:Glycine zipper 2TM domain
MQMIKNAAIALAASGMVLTTAPAAAFEARTASTAAAPMTDALQYDRYDRWDRDDRRYDRRGDRYGRNRGYDEPVYRDTRVWRGNDGRTYCRKKDGTTGLIVGGAVGALLGREVDGGRNRTLGTILGAAGGALLGKELASGYKCS